MNGEPYQEFSLLEKKLAEQPIILPENPFWGIFKRFGRDETLAMFINVIGTGAVEYLCNNNILYALAGPLSIRTREVLLSLTGPVVEKVGFFPAHFKEALEEYRQTPKNERDKLARYFRNAVKKGSKSLIEDIIVHDPLYVGLMYAGLIIHPETPAWLLSIASFVSAVFAVAGIELGLTELAYWNYKRALRKAGFETESYFESRFFVSEDSKPEKVLESIAKEFGLGNADTMKYEDRYFRNKLPVYSGRIPKLRLRKRTAGLGQTAQVQSAQIIYTRANEILDSKIEQYRYFPQRKEKIYFILNQNMPAGIHDINNECARKILEKVQDGQNFRDIKFERSATYDSDKFCVTTDAIENRHRQFYLVELKAYPNRKKLLKEAMRYVMRNFPVVVQTTHGKFELAGMCEF